MRNLPPPLPCLPTEKELDSSSTKLLGEQSRILRWARGSGSSVQDVLLLLEEYKRLAKVFSSEWPAGVGCMCVAATALRWWVVWLLEGERGGP